MSKVILKMGEKITKTDYEGEISPVQLLNGVAHLMRDLQTLSGMQYKEIFAIVDAAVGANVFKKKETVRASESEKASQTI